MSATATVSRASTDLLADTLYSAEDLLSELVTAIGDAKTWAGTSRAEDFEARVHSLVEDLAEEYGIAVIPS